MLFGVRSMLVVRCLLRVACFLLSGSCCLLAVGLCVLLFVA